ncbi:MAG: hypothetical protein Kow0096_18710 [Thiohalomonadaceae bacterium]
MSHIHGRPRAAVLFLVLLENPRPNPHIFSHCMGFACPHTAMVAVPAEDKRPGDEVTEND